MDIDAGNALVHLLKPLAGSTRRTGTTAALGGFGAVFDLKATGYRDPILVATTDGVGTKLKIAIATGHHDSIGIDLVAMSVNDLVVQGAEPLFFLDYFAAGRLDVNVTATVIAGIAEGCRQAGCALVGGETAEMPGMYTEGDYDLAGFAVGAVERTAVVTGKSVIPGDIVLGLASSGLHANGYSLVRRLVAEAGLSYEGPAPFAPDSSLGEALLTPTHIYVTPCLALVRAGLAKAFAHITGGGLLENIPRVLPQACGVVLDAAAWPIPPVFRWLSERVSLPEMARTFNCGIGMMAVVSAADAERAALVLGASARPIGVVVARKNKENDPVVTITSMDAAWRA
ncbi:MAG: purM [Rhodospirillaceae bacterium]|nr:MAG: purM [Rhodospirillaceae bacterium]